MTSAFAGVIFFDFLLYNIHIYAGQLFVVDFVLIISRFFQYAKNPFPKLSGRKILGVQYILPELSRESPSKLCLAQGLFSIKKLLGQVYSCWNCVVHRDILPPQLVTACNWSIQ